MLALYCWYPVPSVLVARAARGFLCFGTPRRAMRRIPAGDSAWRPAQGRQYAPVSGIPARRRSRYLRHHYGVRLRDMYGGQFTDDSAPPVFPARRPAPRPNVATGNRSPRPTPPFRDGTPTSLPGRLSLSFGDVWGN